jgi:hypothetical protein
MFFHNAVILMKLIMGECKEIRVSNAKWWVYNLELEKTAYTFVLL